MLQFVGRDPQLHDQLSGPHIWPGDVHLHLGVVDLADEPIARHVREVPEWARADSFRAAQGNFTRWGFKWTRRCNSKTTTIFTAYYCLYIRGGNVITQCRHRAYYFVECMFIFLYSYISYIGSMDSRAGWSPFRFSRQVSVDCHDIFVPTLMIPWWWIQRFG